MEEEEVPSTEVRNKKKQKRKERKKFPYKKGGPFRTSSN